MMVKICGIRSLEEAAWAIEAGADALGFNFHPPSPRFLPPQEAREIASRLSVPVLKVAVTVVGSAEQAQGFEGMDVIQVHGARSESDLAPYQGRRLWVAVKGDEEDVEDAFAGHEIMVDPSKGRGQRADWDRLGSWRRPFILAGGLTPDNVSEAISKARPFGVDVCSGVETAPGRKDPLRVQRFVIVARQAFDRCRPQEKNERK